MRAAAHANLAVEQMDTCYRQAINLLTSDKVRTAFDLAKEPDELQNRYGGSIFGQSSLLTAPAGGSWDAQLVQVNWYSEPAWLGWDVHGADLPGLARMESPLCPRLDQGLSALLEDLQQGGLLSSTLVIVAGEFGRTPQVNRYGGRDHWPACSSVLFAGGGVPAGAVVGASDSKGAYPSDRQPENIPQLAATLYRLMGIDTNGDLRIKPFIGDALAVAELQS